MTMLSPRFAEALTYANQLHAGQMRKASSTPYIAHLLAVTAIVLEHGGTEDEAIAALLHDAVEDQGGAATRAEISRRFGETVALIVDGSSDTDEEPKPPWRERKEAFIARLASASPQVRLVVAADKLHNARSVAADFRRLGDEVWNRFRGGREGTLWYYRTVTDTLRAAGSSPLVDELDLVVTDLERQVVAASSERSAHA